jgi:hypothetical protein
MSEEKTKENESIVGVKKEDGSNPAVRPVKRERKTFQVPGQTRDTPDENDPLRRFYSSLLAQNTKSEIARRWCVQHGLLPVEEAEKWLAEHGRGSQASQRNSQSPTKKKKLDKRVVKNKASKDRQTLKDDRIKTAKKTPSVKSTSRFKKERIQISSDSDDDTPLVALKK